MADAGIGCRDGQIAGFDDVQAGPYTPPLDQGQRGFYAVEDFSELLHMALVEVQPCSLTRTPRSRILGETVLRPTNLA
ncbi:hypothetical protein D9M71_696800 [compost metagenome]